MKKILFLSLWVQISVVMASHNFESATLPSSITTQSGSISLSKEHFKDGTQSLKWEWNKPNSTLSFTDTAIKNSVGSFDKRGGVTCWIYNETPQPTPLVFNFKDANNRICYTFNFNLKFTGWRAAWIAYQDMWSISGGNTQKENITRMEIIAPQYVTSGALFIDRLEFTNTVDRQATPDAQIPQNNRHLDREIWHWGLLQKWSEMTYDLELPSALSATEKQDMETVHTAIMTQLKGKTLSSSDKTTLNNLVKTLKLTAEGKGAPLMQKNNVKSGDVHFGQLNKVLDLSARGWYIDGDAEKKALFIQAIRYALDQGFAYGSGMGTNHHYGYDTREIYGAIAWMKQPLYEAGLWEEASKMAIYWSGVAEARQPYNLLRDELTDSWNTLILPRLAAATMLDDERNRFRELKSLARWVNQSLCITPGTIGGIKPDGTMFHHGGHYPAYGIPGLAYLGRYVACVNGTLFGLDEDARKVLKLALEAARNYSNLRSWGLGVSGRNPFEGEISSAAVNTFAYAAKAGPTLDRGLAADFIRLKEGLRLYTPDLNLIKEFEKEGVSKATAPQGFFVYNYANQGIYRYNNQMISLKGLSYNLWGSEIYATNNRYGRYQSYGSVQIIGTPSPQSVNNGSPVSEAASRFTEAGWNWNRMPGTTSIHLPWNLLNSPFTGDLMLRQREKYAGASSLEGKFGIFSMKLREASHSTFTPSFVFRKSIFCVGNRIVCLGSNITNENRNNPTETTLFQQALLSTDEVIGFNEELLSGFPINKTAVPDQSVLLKDVTGNYYYVPKGQNLTICKTVQASKNNKTKADTEGNFAVAYLNHGIAPEDAMYEYMILLEPTTNQIDGCKREETGYRVERQDAFAHIVSFPEEHLKVYSFFLKTGEPELMDNWVSEADAETMLMIRNDHGSLNMSICSPDINQSSYNYTNPQESRPVQRKVTLKGLWNLIGMVENVTIEQTDNQTTVYATCQHGIPVEFSLQNIETALENVENSRIRIGRTEDGVSVNSASGTVTITSIDGRIITQKVKNEGIVVFSVPLDKFIVKVVTKEDTKAEIIL